MEGRTLGQGPGHASTEWVWGQKKMTCIGLAR